MKASLIKFGIQISAIVMMGALGALFALMFALVASIVAANLTPQLYFKLVDTLACGGQGILVAESSLGNFHIPGAVSFQCVNPNGNALNHIGVRAIIDFLGLPFLLCFVPTYLPGIYLMWRLSKKLFRIYDETMLEYATS